MIGKKGFVLWTALASLLWLAAFSTLLSAGPQAPANAPAPTGTVRLTLDDIKQRALADNKLLQLAALNVQSKDYATRAARALYFPHIIGNVVYFHFNDNLGTVITAGGRTVTGPRGTPLFTLPVTSVNASVINQETTVSTIAAIQPITDLLKVRQGVRIAEADAGIAQAQMDKGRRELLSGIEQLFWGILAAQRIRGGLIAGAGPIEELAKTGNLEARTALVEGQQGLQQVSTQIAELQEQLATLLSMPTSTQFELVEPPLPAVPVKTADEAVGMALANSPEIREAEDNVAKAEAATRAAKLDYVPSIALIGAYSNQTFADYIQPNIGYVGVMGSYTFVDWGKRRNTIREREQLIGMANLKVQQTQDTVRQNTLKAFRDYEQSKQALGLAEQMVALRTEGEKSAKDMASKFKAGKDTATAQVDYIKADLALRTAYVKLASLIGKE
jgi:outer membrane protein TolC